MDVAQGGAERHHVEVRVFLKEETALEAGMDCLDGRFDAVELFVGLACEVHDTAVEVGCPSGISVAVAYLCSGKAEESLNLTCDVPLA